MLRVLATHRSRKSKEYSHSCTASPIITDPFFRESRFVQTHGSLKTKENGKTPGIWQMEGERNKELKPHAAPVAA